MIQQTIHAEVIPLEPSVQVTKVAIEINVSSIIEELKLYDALFYVELKVDEATYHYSFIKRQITEPVITTYMFVEGILTGEEVVNYTVQISYIAKE